MKQCGSERKKDSKTRKECLPYLANRAEEKTDPSPPCARYLPATAPALLARGAVPALFFTLINGKKDFFIRCFDSRRQEGRCK